MRSYLFGLLVLCRLATATSCQENAFKEQAARVSCGDTESITQCLTSGIDLADFRRLERCFTAAGCETADATVATVWLDHECQLLGERDRQELRKRADGGGDDNTSTNDDQATSSDAKPSPPAPNTETNNTPAKPAQKNATPATPATTEAKTTSASSTSSESKTTESTTASTASSTSTVSAAAVSNSASASTSALVAEGSIQCSVTKMVSTSSCSHFTDGKSSGSSTCFPSLTAVSHCAPGVICKTDAAGNPSCMKADNHLTTSGIVVALVFALGILSFLIAVCVMCMRQRRSFRKAEAMRRQQLGEWKPDVETAATQRQRQQQQQQQARRPAARNLSDMNLPLITHTGTKGSTRTGIEDGERTLLPSRSESPVGGAGALENDLVRGYNRI